MITMLTHSSMAIIRTRMLFHQRPTRVFSTMSSLSVLRRSTF